MSSIKEVGFLLLVLLLSNCSSPLKFGKKTIRVGGVGMYYTLGGLSDELKVFFNQEGFQRILLINQRRIVNSENQWEVDAKKLGDFLRKQVPDEDEQVIIMLNWEGEVFKSILKRNERSAVADSLFVRAYEVVKELRPKTLVGYYGLPIRRYYKRDSSWKQENKKLYPLLKEVDVIFPSVYDFYDSASYQGKGDVEYVRDNVAEALRAGQKIKKPILPVVWHRYHTSNKTLGNTLIPVHEFVEHIATIADTKRNGKKVDAVVWWGSEYSQFATRNKGVFKDKKDLKRAWEENAAEIVPKYYSALRRGLGGSN